MEEQVRKMTREEIEQYRLSDPSEEGEITAGYFIGNSKVLVHEMKHTEEEHRRGLKGVENVLRTIYPGYDVKVTEAGVD